MTTPIEPHQREQMNRIANLLDGAINDSPAAGRYGFVLLVFPFGGGGRMNYISNAERADMLCALKELVANFEGRVVNYEGKA